MMIQNLEETSHTVFKTSDQDMYSSPLHTLQLEKNDVMAALCVNDLNHTACLYFCTAVPCCSLTHMYNCDELKSAVRFYQ